MTSCSHIQLDCWIQSHSVSHCALADIECQCQNDATITYVSHCVVNNCTLQDAIGSFCATFRLELEANNIARYFAFLGASVPPTS